MPAQLFQRTANPGNPLHPYDGKGQYQHQHHRADHFDVIARDLQGANDPFEVGAVLTCENAWLSGRASGSCGRGTGSNPIIQHFDKIDKEPLSASMTPPLNFQPPLNFHPLLNFQPPLNFQPHDGVGDRGRI